MITDTFSDFVNALCQCWTGLNTQTIDDVRGLLMSTASNGREMSWVRQLKSQQFTVQELYHDQKQGFILLAHSEAKNTYRPPHNHGSGWVFYTVLFGEMEMKTYKQVTSSSGESYLVSRGTDTLKTGDCRVFLPGDIHDTRCTSDNLILLRLTSCDFKKELTEGRLIRFTTDDTSIER
ncbi:cupin domain-containing protein [Pseudoalteromonas xiamenensis]